MNTLNISDCALFLKLFNRGGYVLDFTTKSFDVFTKNSIGEALCDKYHLSKGKSLETYLADASAPNAIKLFNDLLTYYEENYVSEYKLPSKESDGFNSKSYDEEYARLYQKCRARMKQILKTPTPLASNLEMFQERFTSDYLQSQIDLMLKMQMENPTEAIGKAKELIESCCKTILEENNVTIDKNWDIGKLTSETLHLLKLTPDTISSEGKVTEYLRSVLGSLRGITKFLSEIRNLYGSGHGKSASFQGLEVRHAKLAVNCGITFVSFVWDTHEAMLEERKKCPL